MCVCLRAELAEHGFRFCTESLEAKLKKQKETPPEEQTGESRGHAHIQIRTTGWCCLFGWLSWLLSSEELEALRKETHLLLGLCLDSRARYRASALHLKQAQQDYQKALDICRQEQGHAHPQVEVLGRSRRWLCRSSSHAHSHLSWKTLVLMSDLATILDLQGHHDDALSLIQQAVDLGRSVGHPDQHVLLGNLAGVLLHTGEFSQVSVKGLSSQPPCLLPQDASMIRFGSTRRL